MPKESSLYIYGFININEKDWSRKAVLGDSETGVYGSGSKEGVYAITNGAAGSYGLRAMHGGGKGAIKAQGDVHLMEGKVGIDTDSPREMLEINGAIKIGKREDSGATAGTVRWNSKIHKLQVFNGRKWIDLH